MPKAWSVLIVSTLVCVMVAFVSRADGEPDVPVPVAEDAATVVDPAEAPPAEATRPRDTGTFLAVVRGSGTMGVILWLTLFAALFAGVWFIVDCSIFVRVNRIIPRQLVENVTQSMAEGDVGKAIENCDNEPGPLANILKAGFSHVEEGFETIQDAVGVAAEMESESLLQRISYLSVVGNLSPMLGLLGTVQGMIYAFATLATESGAAQTGVLAMNISQALYTTAAGLSIAVPAVTAYFIFRNRASKIILRMEAMTLDLIKDLRNVEVVES